MASHVRFEPSDIDGLVASGTTLAEAAERLGVEIDLACGGQGECDRCAVEVREGADALSEITDAENEQLGERTLGGLRLACQAKIHGEECSVRVLYSKSDPSASGRTGDSETGEGAAEGSAEARDRIREAFTSMSPSEQFSTALELQYKVAEEFLGSLFAGPMRVGEQIFNSLLGPSAPAESPAEGEPAPPAEGEPETAPEEVQETKEAAPTGDGSEETDTTNEQF